MERAFARLILLAGLVLPATLPAQIYMCTAPDGTRIYSDERCGSDAKVVPGISTGRKRSDVTKSSTLPLKPVAKSETELQALSSRCDAGETQACNEWTRSGGPALLKADERKLEQACTSGELKACEERYCRDGATKDCRARVKETAPASGNDWYLRTTGQRRADGTTEYAVRCMPAGDLAIRDVSISCAAQAGPQRCSAAGNTAAATMSETAAALCGARR